MGQKVSDKMISDYLFGSLFFLSFLPVWLVVFVRAIWSICLEDQPHCAEWSEVVLLPLFLLGTIAVVHYRFEKEGLETKGVKLLSVTPRRDAPIEFLLSNVLAFVAFDYTKGIEALLMFVLLIVLGVACRRFHGLFWNFWLACLKFREYECLIQEGDKKENVCIITRHAILDKINPDISVDLHRLDQFGLCRYDGKNQVNDGSIESVGADSIHATI